MVQLHNVTTTAGQSFISAAKLCSEEDYTPGSLLVPFQYPFIQLEYFDYIFPQKKNPNKLTITYLPSSFFIAI